MGRPDLTVVPDLDRELDELYGLPLERFTAARNELAKRLRKAGQKADADRVGALAKPSVSAWALNQLARREPEAVRALLEAGDALVDAQKRALAGRSAGTLDDASGRQREAVRKLVPAAAKLLEDAGHRPSDAIKTRLASSLRAASVDPDGRVLLERGRLQQDVESGGLELLVGLAPARAEPASAPPSPGERRAARVREAREKLESARATEQRLAEEAADAEREAERAAAAAEEAAERARALAADEARARKAVEQAQKALDRVESK
jgi:hypothetical protein